MNIDKIAILKDKLTMRDVLIRYGFEPKKRMKCPLHGGDDKNFSVMEKGYMCFSHCGGGDVISFVQKLFNLSFGDTLKKIDDDFSLGLYERKSPQDFVRLKRQAEALKGNREREKTAKQHAEDEYWAAFDEWKRLDENKRKYAPKSIEDMENLNPLFVEACRKLDFQEYLLECAEIRRNEKCIE